MKIIIFVYLLLATNKIFAAPITVDHEFIVSSKYYSCDQSPDDSYNNAYLQLIANANKLCAPKIAQQITGAVMYSNYCFITLSAGFSCPRGDGVTCRPVQFGMRCCDNKNYCWIE